MFRRKGTKSKFSLFKQENRSQTKLPDPQPEKKIIEVKTDDNVESTKTEEIDKNIEQTNERDTKADDKEGKRDKPSQNVVKNNEALFTDSTKMKVGTENIFSLFWDKNLSSRLVPIEITKTAHFIPNGIALQELLLESTGIVGRSSWINKHERTYNEYAVAVGYFYLYYIQILRAKEAASDLDGYENSCLKRFLKMHPEESIPIAEPFFPYFSSIVSTQLEDRKYDWVIPSYGTFTGRNNFESRNNFDQCVEYIRPQIPYMLAILSSFGATPKANLDDRIDDDGIFRPIDITNQNAVHVFNSDMRLDRAQAPVALNMIFYTCGTSYPFRFHNENVEDARKYMKSTCFYGPKGVNFSCIANQNVDGALAESIDISRIDNFLLMSKEKNPRWFDYIKEQMKIFSKHWSAQYNLSQVPKTGGLESSIICRLHKDTINGNVYEYTDHILNIGDERIVDWYQQKFRNMTGSFKTTRAGIERPEELQAITFGINATPPITTATGHPEHFRQGQYFTHGEALNSATLAMELGSDDGSKGPIEMYAGWRSDVFQSIFRAEPSGQRG